jgi:membrane-bound ClpP family serine protease
VNSLALALAVVATVLMLGGALVMTAGNFGVAGALFLTASIVIYLRERWL